MPDPDEFVPPSAASDAAGDQIFAESAAKVAPLERERLREEARQAAESEPPY